MISVVILTFNEEVNIKKCLQSVAWTDDVIVIDSGSNDKTCEIAKSFNSKILHRKFDNFANQRNYAIDHGDLKYNWVLHLDADEVVSKELHLEMKEIIQNKTEFSAYQIPSKLIFLGKWLKFSGMYPSYQVRFGKKDKLRFKMVGHGQRETLPINEVGIFKGFLIHYNFSKGISEWISKHSKYAKAEALLALSNNYAVTLDDLKYLLSSNKTKKRRSLKKLSLLIPFRPFFRFCYIYFIRLGFLDGIAGLQYALLISNYQWFIDLNIKELKQNKDKF